MFRLYSLALILFFILPSVAAQDEYILGPGDKILIQVYGQEDLKLEALLGNSGLINYPFLGEVKIAGFTIKQVENLISTGLKDGYLISPNVYAQVVEHRPFYIHGEVEKPGAYPYNPGMSINQAIALAGGLTERASEEKIYLYKEGNNKSQMLATLDTKVSAGDTIKIEQRFF